MTSAPVTPAPDAAPLSEPQRILGTFIAPSKTFADIRRSAAWWGPFAVTVIISIMFVYAVDAKIGFRKVTENQIERSPKASQRMEQLSRDDREKSMAMQTKFTRGFSYGFPAFILVWHLVVAALLFGTLKLVLSAEISFTKTFAVIMYAILPMGLKSILAIVTIFAGMNPDSFSMQNPAPTNLGFFLNQVETPFLYALGSAFDVFMIWTLILTALGLSIIAKKVKLSTALIVVFGWYLFFAVGSAAVAAAFA